MSYMSQLHVALIHLVYWSHYGAVLGSVHFTQSRYKGSLLFKSCVNRPCLVCPMESGTTSGQEVHTARQDCLGLEGLHLSAVVTAPWPPSVCMHTQRPQQSLVLERPSLVTYPGLFHLSHREQMG